MNDDDFPTDTLPLDPIDTEEGRDIALLYLSEQDLDKERCVSSIIQEGEDMVMRVRYPDGTEELFDLLVRRSFIRTAGESN